MSITDHPGFLLALAECGLLASQANAIVEAIRAVELSASDPARYWTAADEDPRPWPPNQEPCPTTLVPWFEKCIERALRKTLPSLSENSSSDPLHEMTAGEIMRASENGVQR